ncbi:MAG: sigma-70 family RNA polymerase sigma factor [Acidobacteriota bacterium]
MAVDESSKRAGAEAGDAVESLAEQSDVTRLLDEWSDGDPEALVDLMPLVIDDLRRIAESHLAREGRGHTLQPTALVNEAYLRLAGRRTVSWRNRAQFFGFTARLMRNILVEHARSKQAAKRGHGTVRVTLIDELGVADKDTDGVDLLAVDEALHALAEIDPRQEQIVTLRFFAGLTVDETASALDISTATVKREWRIAKLWLMERLSR